MSLEQTISFDRGETAILPFSVENDGSIVDLTGAALEWKMSDSGKKYLDLSNPGVSVVNRNDTAGEFSIEINANATDGLPARTYQETITITESNGDVTKESGRVRIEEV